MSSYIQRMIQRNTGRLTGVSPLFSSLYVQREESETDAEEENAPDSSGSLDSSDSTDESQDTGEDSTQESQEGGEEDSIQRKSIDTPRAPARTPAPRQSVPKNIEKPKVNSTSSEKAVSENGMNSVDAPLLEIRAPHLQEPGSKQKQTREAEYSIPEKAIHEKRPEEEPVASNHLPENFPEKFPDTFKRRPDTASATHSSWGKQPITKPTSEVPGLDSIIDEIDFESPSTPSRKGTPAHVKTESESSPSRVKDFKASQTVHPGTVRKERAPTYKTSAINKDRNPDPSDPVEEKREAKVGTEERPDYSSVKRDGRNESRSRSNINPSPPSTRRESESKDIINVNIGRIEVRAVQDMDIPMPAPAPAPAKESGIQSLEEYLKQRNGEDW